MPADKRSTSKSGTLITRLYPETKDEFKKIAQKKGVSMNDLMTEFIEKYIKENK